MSLSDQILTSISLLAYLFVSYSFLYSMFFQGRERTDLSSSAQSSPAHSPHSDEGGKFSYYFS